MTWTSGSLRALALAVTIGPLAAAACKPAPPVATGSAEAAMFVGPENLTIAKQETLQVGPAISGTLEAERQAQVRAELPGALIAVEAEPGQPVQRGVVLGRIDDAGVRDAETSARSAVTTAELNVALARRNVERTRALANAGAIADRDLEQAEWNLSSAEAEQADARARAAAAAKQLDRTIIRAPFTGIVSERPANLGDIVQTGTPLFTVVDPSALKLEGAVPADGLDQLKLGTPVAVTVAGAGPAPLRGRISRINPVVDPATRQVRVTVAVPNASGRLMSGLFADGRVATAERVSVVVPSGAVDRTGIRPLVVRLREGRVERVEVELGLIDDGLERIELRSGIVPGDTVLLGGARGLPPGTPVRIGSPAEIEERHAAVPAKE
ncbi:MAG TPA: efflux RND transporter periplasmic adaptor subunit [Gemmatimonadales bacterium]|nr:efflux RND transporter periplasmic adaptor subunit [Gemmatimonadales bacterium]